MKTNELKKRIDAFIGHVKESLNGDADVVNFWVDLFCGAGGTSTGIQFAGVNSFVAGCVNHDAKAIESHEVNHPFTVHFREDIRDFEVVQQLRVVVDALRKAFPGCFVSVWASLECTNFSKAKGGMPRNADSRTLAEHMFMYIEALDPDYFWVENVREFMAWGPLDENGRPVSRTAGRDYLKWVDNIRNYGYTFDWKLFNAADFGAYQSRERLFLQFAKKGLPLNWPEPTHAKRAKKTGTADLFEGMEKQQAWKAVREVLDLMDEGESIFTRKKPLVDKTMNVIIAGVVKAIEENESGFLFKYYGSGDNLNSYSVPAGTLTTKDRFAKIQLIFNQYKSGSVSSIDVPVGAQTTNPKANLLSFILNPSHGGHTTSIEKPSPVIIARQDKSPLYIIHALMSEYGIVDIKMRMLKIEELLRIQGFPDGYQLRGTKTDQKKFIGNAVEVTQAKVLADAHYKALVRYVREKRKAKIKL